MNRTEILNSLTLKQAKAAFATFDSLCAKMPNLEYNSYDYRRYVSWAIARAASTAKISNQKMQTLLDGFDGAMERAKK